LFSNGLHGCILNFFNIFWCLVTLNVCHLQQTLHRP
jgi:hypothetical protein